jgi:hypothetical protein
MRPGVATLSKPTEQPKVQLASVDVDGRHGHAHGVAQPVRVAAPQAVNHVPGAVEAVLVVDEGADRNDPLGR